MEPVFVTRGSVGLSVVRGTANRSTIFEEKIDRKNTAQERGQATKQIRCHVFSPDGRFYAYCDGLSTRILDTSNWKPYLILDDQHHAKNSALHFSPSSNFLCTYQNVFSVRATSSNAPAQPTSTEPNLRILDLKSKTFVAQFMDKNRQKWQPWWTNDEKICARLVGSELLFHENNNFKPGSYSHKLVLPRMVDYSLSGPSEPLHVAAYVPASNDHPAIVKIFRYPYFEQSIAFKTFYKADRVNIQWNRAGTCLILTAITDIDSTGESYYGSSNLYFLSTNGDTYLIGLKKAGPVYSVEWSPNGQHYCVVHGYMPAKVTMFNLKGDDIFDFGTGPRNEAHFDPFGKVLALCGFGNLRGQIQFWGKEEGGGAPRSHPSFKRLCEYKAEDTTLFRWCPDGIHILTATTSPRLRVHNGWTIWKYDGTKVAQFDYPANEELWDVIWMPQPQMNEQPLQICLSNSVGEKAGGNKESAAYVPPHMRGMANKPSFKLHEFEPASSEKNNSAQEEANLSKNALKNRKKLENKRAKKEEQRQAALATGASAATFNKSEALVRPPTTREATGVALQSPADAERVKKMKQISKKLEQITTYKQRLANGETLELNQLDKIKNETELQEELEALQL